MKSLWAVLCVAILAQPNSPGLVAQAKKLTDNPLIKFAGVVNLCERRDATSVAACGSYITGFVQGSHVTITVAVIETVAEGVARGKVPPTDQAIDAATAKAYKDSRQFCVDASWTAGYVQAHVLQHAREHPELLKEPADEQMLRVLVRAFPCSTKNQADWR